MEEIQGTYGGLEQVKGVMEKALAGTMGSGWVWLVRDTGTGALGVRSYAVSSSYAHVPAYLGFPPL